MGASRNTEIPKVEGLADASLANYNKSIYRLRPSRCYYTPTGNANIQVGALDTNQMHP